MTNVESLIINAINALTADTSTEPESANVVSNNELEKATAKKGAKKGAKKSAKSNDDNASETAAKSQPAKKGAKKSAKKADKSNNGNELEKEAKDNAANAANKSAKSQAAKKRDVTASQEAEVIIECTDNTLTQQQEWINKVDSFSEAFKREEVIKNLELTGSIWDTMSYDQREGVKRWVTNKIITSTTILPQDAYEFIALFVNHTPPKKGDYKETQNEYFGRVTAQAKGILFALYKVIAMEYAFSALTHVKQGETDEAKAALVRSSFFVYDRQKATGQLYGEVANIERAYVQFNGVSLISETIKRRVANPEYAEFLTDVEKLTSDFKVAKAGRKKALAFCKSLRAAIKAKDWKTCRSLVNTERQTNYTAYTNDELAIMHNMRRSYYLRNGVNVYVELESLIRTRRDKKAAKRNESND